jgi:predicted DNA-binding protein (MmcQ/YjbR family)
VKEALRRLRDVCRTLDDVTETLAWGHPNFKVGGKTFAALEEYGGEPTLCVKLDKVEQKKRVASDPRFFVAPYIGRHGWTSLRLTGKVDWDEVRGLVKSSHALITEKAAGPRDDFHRRRYLAITAL